MTQPDPTAPRRGERVLAYMFVAMVAVTVLAILLLLCSAFLGNSGNFDEGLWPVIAVTPLIALPFAFIMGFALFIVVARRRSRESALAASTPVEASRNGTRAGTKAGRRSPARPSKSK